jgi:peptidoglycan DL-endopeptidase CwlO
MPARRLPLRRGLVRVTACVLLAGLAVATSTLVSADRQPAAASPASAGQLQRRLEKLNAQADQQVEDYLQAQLALRRTRASIRMLQGQLDGVHRQLADARAGIAARAAVAYTQGPATDVVSLLTARDPRQVLERAQLLELLATQGSDAVATATAIERAAQARAAELAAVEQRQAAILGQLADRKAAIERLVSQTEQTLSRLRAADRRRAAAVDRPAAPGSARPPATLTGSVAAVVRYAYAQLGKPYRWGAAGPDAFDCSGLTMMAWAQAGVSLPHSSQAQFGVGRQVTRAELRAGDLIFRNSPISHVSLYVGNGMQVAATHTGSTVKLQSAWQGDIVGFSRPTG